MINFKALSLAVTMLISTTASNVYSFKQGKFCNHHFFELDRKDDIFESKLENYSELPDVGNKYFSYLLGQTRAKKMIKDAIKDAKNNNNSKLVIFDSDNKNYSIWYLIKFSKDRKRCHLNYIKGLYDQHTIKDISDIDPSIFVYPFMYNDDLKSLYLDFNNFSEQDKKKLAEMGFEGDIDDLSLRRAEDIGTLRMDRDKFLKYRDNVIYGGRT